MIQENAIPILDLDLGISGIDPVMDSVNTFMMIVEFQHNGSAYVADLSKGKPISIPLDFDGAQANHFGATKASRAPLELGGFVGDTAQGAGCNVDVLRLIPHCNGTHSESVGHIVNQAVPVHEVVGSSLMVGRVVSIEPVPVSQVGEESYRPDFEERDQLITAASLKEHFSNFENVHCLIIRTLPNSDSKTSREYSDVNQPAFFTVNAIEWIVAQGVNQLMVDLPSIDRMYDGGLLTNHHLFWNVPEATHELTESTRRDRTITEMVFVPDEITDGDYLVGLQVPSFCSDAAPSRPILYSFEQRTDQ